VVLKIRDIDQTQAPLLDHLVELRTRLLRCVLALAVAFAVCFYFANDIFAVLVRPLAGAFPEGTDAKLVYTKLYEAFFVEIKVAIFAAFFVTFPIIANQLWAFVAPGLYAKEKKAFLPFLLATPVLFIAGAALAYFIVMPTAFRWLLGFQGEVIDGLSQEALPTMDSYLDLVMRFILAFGISFLLPVLMLLLNRAGIITREQFATSRRFVIVGIFVVAAVATPPDVVSQLILAIPLMILFEGSLLLMPKAKPEDEKSEDAKQQALPSPAPEQAGESAPPPPAAS
jgi:sec-independent protein translocase protein TatC